MTSRTVVTFLLLILLLPALSRADSGYVRDPDYKAPKVPWITDQDWSEIMATAREHDKPVLIDFTATWCGPCRLLDAMVFNEGEVIDELAEVVTFKVDIDKPEYAALKENFEIVKVPTLVWCDQRGKEVDRFTGYKSSKEFLAIVRGWRDNRTIDRMLAERRAESPEDPEVLLDLARRHADRGQVREAEILYRRLMNLREGTSKRTVARGMLGLADMAVDAGREDEARDLGRRAAQVFVPFDPEAGGDFEGMLEVAAYQESAGDTLGVLDTYRTMVEADDREVLALDGFARAAVGARTDLREATTYAIRATVFSDKDPAVIATLADCYYYQGRYRRAIKWINQAVEQAPDDEAFTGRLARYEAALADDPHGLKGVPD
jgi:thioredoxin-like negative regulator of GroEL